VLSQAMIVQELFTFARRADEGKSMPLFRTQQWHFFVVACFYLYGRCAPLDQLFVPLTCSHAILSQREGSSMHLQDSVAVQVF
jgi:hypothetical protein